MPKFCIKCKMGDPLPHDERIGQVIYNHLRPTVKDVEHEKVIDLLDHDKYQSQLADRLFNLPDHELQRLFFDRLWCAKCKKAVNQI